MDYEMAFMLISVAGDSKADSENAIKAALDNDFDRAEQLLRMAEQKMIEAHKLQTGMIHNEANGHIVEVNIILVHAQDHLTMALMAKDNAQTFILLLKHLQELENKIKSFGER